MENPKYKRQNEWRKRNPWIRRHLRLKQYGLTIEDYETILQRQNSQCAICGTTKPGGQGKQLYVDHDHSTGKVRGLLCHACNTSLGAFENNPELLLKAYEYLHEDKSGVEQIILSAVEPIFDRYKCGSEQRRRIEHLWYEYGLTIEAYDTLLQSQKRVCAVCGVKTPGGRGKYFRVDHNHTTSEIRGLLCHSCNVSLGAFEKNPQLLLKAYNYLKSQ